MFALKSQLTSRDLTSFFVFSTRSGTCLDNEYNLVAHRWLQTGHIVHRVHQCKSTDGNFGTHEKVAIAIPIVTCILYIPILILGIFVFPFPRTSLIGWKVYLRGTWRIRLNDKCGGDAAFVKLLWPVVLGTVVGHKRIVINYSLVRR